MAGPSDSITVSRVEVGQGILLKLQGAINESLSEHIFKEVTGEVLIVDLDGVDRISSYGVRQWTQALKNCSAKYIGFVKCRPMLMVQFNSIANFAGHGQLITFYSPFVCEGCGEEFEKLTDLRTAYDEVKKMEPPKASCPKCNGAGEFDDLPEVYFSYPASQPKPSLSALASAIVDGGTAPKVAANPFRAEQDFDGNLTVLWMKGELSAQTRIKRLIQGLEGEVLLVAGELEEPKGEDSIAKLLEFFAPSNATVSIARLSPAWVSAVVKMGSQSLRDRVISYRQKQACRNCPSELTVDWDERNWKLDKNRVSAQIKCQKCGLVNDVLATDELMKLVEVTKVKPTVAKVTAYLEKNTNAPLFLKTERTGSTTSLEGNKLGKYKLQKVIGTGGMAQVFLAKQEGLGGFEKTVVVKRIMPGLARDKGFIEMFLQEAKLAARVAHANVVQIFDVGEEQGEYYMAMEYLKGLDLNILLRTASQLKKMPPVGVAVRILSQVCRGLHSAHTWVDESGKVVPILHRDVSPHNVMIGVDGIVKVTDFGIAKAGDSISTTPQSAVKGKLAYVAPEQLSGSVVDHRVDVFAAGIILYQMLTLRHPFRKATEAETTMAMLHEQPAPVSNIPPALSQVLQKAMSKDKSTRYLSAADFATGLDGVAQKLDHGTDQAVADWMNELLSVIRSEGDVPALQSMTPSRTGSKSVPDEVTPAIPLEKKLTNIP